MQLKQLTAVVALASGLATAQTTAPPLMGALGNTTVAGNGTGVMSDGKYVISAEGIRANFIPYGASISNLFINDTHGVERDIVLGWDNATYYTEDPRHPYFGPVPGRYANRIRNGSFEIDGMTYQTAVNENNGSDTLHGGLRGWSWRNWTVTAHTTDSITFSLVDPDGDQGFPGEVISYVTYTVTPYTWFIRMSAVSTQVSTPIMLTSHTYWNLDGFANPDTQLILNHTLYMPYAGQYVEIDGIEIPTGNILAAQPGSFNDFWTEPREIGSRFGDPTGENNCGTGCYGYDNCWVFNRDAVGPFNWQLQGPVASLSSNFSGIQVDIFTDQDAFQIYTCNNMNGTTPMKSTQGLPGQRTYQKYGCVVMEVEDWIDGINQPSWGRQKRQIFGPGDPPYQLNARYDFSVVGGGNSADYANQYGYGGMKKRGPAS